MSDNKTTESSRFFHISNAVIAGLILLLITTVCGTMYGWISNWYRLKNTTELLRQEQVNRQIESTQNTNTIDSLTLNIKEKDKELSNVLTALDDEKKKNAKLTEALGPFASELNKNESAEKSSQSEIVPPKGFPKSLAEIQQLLKGKTPEEVFAILGKADSASGAGMGEVWMYFGKHKLIKDDFRGSNKALTIMFLGGKAKTIDSMTIADPAAF